MPSSLILDQNYINTKNQVIKAERRILKELGFCVHVKHPHKVSLKHTQAFHICSYFRFEIVSQMCPHSKQFVESPKNVTPAACFGLFYIISFLRFQIIVMYLQVLECEKNQTLVQTAW